MTPSPSLTRHLIGELRAHQPFARMAQATLERLLAGASESYFAPDEVVLAPEHGVAAYLWWVRRGAAVGRTAAGEVFHFGPGDLFPIGAVVGERAVTSTYSADGDLFCLAFDAALVRQQAAVDMALADHLNRRLQSLLALSSGRLQAAVSSQVLAEQTFDTALATLPRRAPVAVGPQASLREALEAMQRAQVGSVMVLDGDGAALGILTRHDLLERVALREPPLDTRATPVTQLMSSPVHTLDIGARVHDAAILMSRHGTRHVPLTEGRRVVSMVSERDLFALQRLSMKSLSNSLRRAASVATLRELAPRIRDFARHLLGQGLAARTLTALVSHLNDLLVQRLVLLLAAEAGLDLARACWLAFGSEGRGEQTIATDQDNGLLLDDAIDDAELQRWLAFGREVNAQLDACGFPLCKGGVMAGNPACCQRQRDWLQRLHQWIERGQPEDLLAASIYFDLRPLTGATALAEPLREAIASAAGAPRFLRLLAENSLRLKPALNWRGAIDTRRENGRDWVDLKLNGSAVFVDAARLMMLAAGASAPGTRERLIESGARTGAQAAEREGWASAFDVLQTLRLRAQVGGQGAADAPNRIDVASLDDIDRSLLKEALTTARRLQQRLELDFLR